MTEANLIRQKEKEILIYIKHLRTAKGFSQYELGERIGVSQNAYYKIEKGVTKLDLQRLIKLSFIFEIELPLLVR
jgi:transcriptional regulator with XRE-family HTH domain